MNKSLMALLFSAFFLLLVLLVSAINYPVAELGNCKSESECAVYCDDFSHLEQCLSFAEKNNMMSEEELKKAKIMLPFINKMGCKNQKECEKYCKDDENIMQCIEIGYRLGEVSQKQYDVMKITGGKGPGGCKLDECNIYCNEKIHLIECTDFALQNGMISAEEAETIKITGGEGPGKCKGKRDCDSYCKKNENIIECVKFAEEHGLIEPEEADLIIEAGGTDKDTIDAFCNRNIENWKRCTALWLEKGLMTPEEADKSIRYRENKLGNCEPGDERCAAEFCSTDENIEECWRYEIAIGEKTTSEYYAWKQQLEEKEVTGRK